MKERALKSSTCTNDCWAFCDAILPEVSRSFALIIPRCPPPIDHSLCVAYLLCRIADTIEDEPALDDRGRGELYDRFLSAVDQPADASCVAGFQRAWPAISDESCARLIAGAGEVLAAFQSLPAAHQTPIRRCVREMIAGMRTIRPVECRNGTSFFCGDLDALDRYCHYVAGTVGIMSTELFEMRFATQGRGDLLPQAKSPVFTPSPQWREEGRRLGLGLQMTNIIKDYRVDAARGVSFIPAEYWDWTSRDRQLLPSGSRELIHHAISHLDAGLRYALAVPPDETGIRTFLLGSLLPAIATLELAARGDSHQPKISRSTMGDIFELIDRQICDNKKLSAAYAGYRTHLQF